MTAIVLVNWNGADDTIACLESLRQVEESHFVVIADNCSSDDSVLRIQKWIEEHSSEVDEYQLLALDRNYGFAIANNKALSVAMLRNPDYYILLNNDTEVEPDFLKRMVDYAKLNPNVKALSPCICYYAEKDVVWFAGGQLTFASRKIIGKGRESKLLPDLPYPITFLSGCALFFEKSLLNEKGELLYNGFFFGEEDYEFALRMQKLGVQMMAIPQSVVYHKVASSQKKTNDSHGLGRAYMYYHNRLISLRLYSPVFKFRLIHLFTCLNSIRYFKHYTQSWLTALSIARYLWNETLKKNGFDYADFNALMLEGNYFPFSIDKCK